MNPIIPVLAQAAGFGGLIGGSCECINEFEENGRYFGLGVIVAVALRAIAYLCNVGAAVGAALGVTWLAAQAVGLIPINDDQNSLIKAIGITVFGGTLGYLVGLMNPPQWVFVL